MNRQSSFQTDQPTLYIVSTPIGNLADVSYRAVSILKSVDVIFCEDTRTSGVLLSHYDIHRPTEPYHDHNKHAASGRMLALLQEGKHVALISDAGTPLLSDPGHVVVNDVIAAGYPVVPIPGASALLAALAVSGLPPHPFLFFGFLDAKASKRADQLETLSRLPYTLVFYESPHRVHKTVESMHEILGERPLVLARELTKRYEELIRGTTSSLRDLGPLKGEIVLLVGGATDTTAWSDDDLLAEIEELIAAGTSNKDAIRIVASRHDLAKNDVYALYHRSDTKE